MEAIGLHDSSLDSIQVSILDKTCLVRVLGVTGDIPEGAGADISCGGLDSFFLTLESEEMLDNARPGNVQDGHFEGGQVLRFYLTGGMVEARVGTLAAQVKSTSKHCSLTAELEGKRSRFDSDIATGLDFAVLTGFWYSDVRKAFCARLLVPTVSLPERVPESVERVPVSVYFEAVRSCTVRFDSSAMLGHEPFGNVKGCIVDDNRGVSWLYLRNGIIEVSAGAASMTFG